MLRSTDKKFFYGWAVVGGCFLLCIAGMGLVTNLVSLFTKPVCQALGVGRSAFSLSATIISLCQMVAAPFMGQLYSKAKRPRLFMIIGSCAVTCAMFCYSFAKSIYVFYICAAVCGLFNSFVTGVAMSTIIANWFVERRGFAYGLALTGSGFAALAFAPLLSRIIESYGWQNGYRFISILYFILTVPVIGLILRFKPEEKGLNALGGDRQGSRDAGELQGVSRATAVRSPIFWVLNIAIFLTGMCCMGTQQHVVSYFSDIGYSPEYAARVFSIMMGVMIVGKIALGWVLDKFGIRTALIYGFSLIFAALAVLLFATNKLAMWAFAVLFGLANAMQTVPSPIIMSKYFGDKYYPQIIGISHIGQSLGMAFGTTFSSIIFDKFGSYTYVWAIYIVMTMLSFVLQMNANTLSRRRPLY